MRYHFSKLKFVVIVVCEFDSVKREYWEREFYEMNVCLFIN